MGEGYDNNDKKLTRYGVWGPIWIESSSSWFVRSFEIFSKISICFIGSIHVHRINLIILHILNVLNINDVFKSKFCRFKMASSSIGFPLLKDSDGSTFFDNVISSRPLLYGNLVTSLFPLGTSTLNPSPLTHSVVSENLCDVSVPVFEPKVCIPRRCTSHMLLFFAQITVLV